MVNDDHIRRINESLNQDLRKERWEAGKFVAPMETKAQQEARHYHEYLKDFWMNINGGNER
jgi:hypothetical protein